MQAVTSRPRTAYLLTYALTIAWIAGTTARAGDVAPFRNPRVPREERVQDYLSRLSLQQKSQLLNHRGPDVVADGFSLRADQWNQCLNGVKWDRPTTLFPSCVGLAATWDTTLVQAVATVLADEARAIYNGWHLDPAAAGEHKGLIYRAPVINIGRNPYWGRNHEAWGEDRFLTGRMAVAYVQGLQGDDPRYLKIAATLKHFAVNNVEQDRQSLEARVPERMLREYWLPHFRDAVVEGHASSLMASYNAINGTPNNINRWLLTDVLKHEWKHAGFVVSDLGGVKTMVEGHAAGKMAYVDAVAKSLMAGCDFSDKEFEIHIPTAVSEGQLSEARLDDALARVLGVRFRLGEFDQFETVRYSRIPPAVIDSAEHRAVALKAARESIVLLQNRGRLLPLDAARLRRVAVIGPLADRIVLNNYNGQTGRTVTPLQGIQAYIGQFAEVTYVRGTDVIDAAAPISTTDHEEEFSGHASMKLDAQDLGQFIEFPVEVPADGRYDIKLHYKGFPSRGVYQLSVDGARQGAPVDMYASAENYGRSAAYGAIELTAGTHRFRFTAVGKNVASSSYTGHFDRLVLAGPQELSLELEAVPATTGGGGERSIAQAAQVARDADVAIVFVGTDARVEQEGRDRTSLGLPRCQQELVEAVFAANPRTVVVLMSAGPLTVPWLKQNIPAMLQAWWGGEEGGQAIADVLFGAVNPAGRLPHTVYADAAQVPPQDEYDISQGFTYMYLRGDPLFAFGHGLSYTQFTYASLRLSAESIGSDSGITATVEIENSGPRAGDEVVQLYTRALSPSVTRPAKELRGFTRIALEPGEKRSIVFTVPAEKLAYWDEEQDAFVVESGDYEVLIGASSADIRARATFVVR